MTNKRVRRSHSPHSPPSDSPHSPPSDSARSADSTDLVTLNIEGEYNPNSLARYLNACVLPRKNYDEYLAARRHMVSVGWKVEMNEKGKGGIYYVSPDKKSTTSNFMDACLLQLCTVPLELGHRFCNTCNFDSGTNHLTSYCSENCMSVSKKLEKVLWRHFPALLDATWTLLKGNQMLPFSHQHPMVIGAYKLFEHSFHPELLDELVYGYGKYLGFYMAVFWCKDIITCGIAFRFHMRYNEKCVELTLAATAEPHQKKGYLRAMMNKFENILKMFQVTVIYLPSLSDRTKMWTEKFGFQKVPNHVVPPGIVCFSNTDMLSKRL